MRVRFSLGFALLLTTSPCLSQSIEPLVHEGIVAAPIETVWNAWTTSEGLRSWLAPHADIELKIGGRMRSNYNAQGSLDDAQTIENAILSYEPLRMLSIQVSKAPDGFPFADTIRDMWTVIYFEPRARNQTLVRVVALGFIAGEQSQAMRAFFDRGNALTIQQLQARIGAGAPPGATAGDGQ
jgi:uncharacterized protein YndB with AHSA1/START domain